MTKKEPLIGRMQRLPEDWWKSLTEMARFEGISVNQLIAQKLLPEIEQYNRDKRRRKPSELRCAGRPSKKKEASKK